MYEIINLKYKANKIKQKRSEVSRLLIESSSNIKSGEIDAISTADLQLLFQLYDQIFLDNWFKTRYRGKF